MSIEVVKRRVYGESGEKRGRDAGREKEEKEGEEREEREAACRWNCAGREATE